MSKIIVFDGVDGAGKTTQIKLLKDKLRDELGYTVYTLHFPVYDDDSSFFVRKFLNDDIGEDKNPYAVSMMYSLDRWLYFNTHEIGRIIRSDNPNTIFLTDRYTSTTLLYQGAMLRRIAHDDTMVHDFIREIITMDHTKLNIPKPDILILFNANIIRSVEIAAERAYQQGIEVDICESDSNLQHEVHNMYDFVKGYYNTVILDCMDSETNSNLAPMNVIHERIMEHLKSQLII